MTTTFVVTTMSALTSLTAKGVKMNGDTVWSCGLRLKFGENRQSPSIGPVRSLVPLTSVVVGYLPASEYNYLSTPREMTEDGNF